MLVPAPSSPVSIFVCFVPTDLLGDCWAVTDPALHHTPALCVLPVVQHPLPPSADTAHSALLPVDFLCSSPGPFQKLLLMGKVPWNTWSCRREASSNFLRVASPLGEVVHSRCPHATPCAGPPPGHYPRARNSASPVSWQDAVQLGCPSPTVLCLLHAFPQHSSDGALLPHCFDTELRFKMSFLL